jgi:alpha-tubulin suppressor-like RCC1 family protein
MLYSDYMVLGWGSNEHGQLGLHTPSSINGLVPHAIDLKTLIPPTGLNATPRDVCTTSYGTTSSSRVWAVAGGLVSGILHQDRVLKLWGDNNPFNNINTNESDQEIGDKNDRTRSTTTYVADIEGVSINQDHMLLLLRCGLLVEMSLTGDRVSASGGNASTRGRNQVPKPPFVVSYPCPRDSIRLNRGEDGKYRFAINHTMEVDGQSEANLHIPTPPGLTGNRLANTNKLANTSKIAKICAGLRHSVAITASGEIFCWGDNRHGQCCDRNNSRTDDSGGGHHSGWTHPEGLMFVDVSSGARHSVAIDDEGVVWSWGDNRYGALGRDTHASSTGKSYDATPRRVEGLDPTVKWKRVSCHSITYTLLVFVTA